MTTFDTEVPLQPSPEELDYAATTARQGLRCDCVAITWDREDGSIVIGADRLARDDAPIEAQLAAAVARLRGAGARAHIDLRGEDIDPARDASPFARHLAVPMVLNERRVGALHVLNRNRSDPLDVSLVDTIAAYCAALLQNRRARAATSGGRGIQDAVLDELAFTPESLTELIPRLERALAPIFGVIRVGLMVWDDERAVLQMVRGSFGASERVTALRQVDVGASRSNAEWVYRVLRAYISKAEVDDPEVLCDYGEAFGVERLVSVPLGDNERHTGILHIARSGAPFTTPELEWCEEIMPQVIVAVESTRSRMKLSMQRQVETVLSQQAVAIASGAWSNDGLRQALDDLRRLFRATIVALVPGDSRPVVAKDESAPAAVEQLLLEAARSERGERAHFQRPSGADTPGSATVFVPVRLGTQPVGMLATFRDRYESFTAEERHGLSRMADLIALSWASERYQQHRAALARLEERQRIADDLHDHVAQILFAAQVQLDAILTHNPIPQDVRSRATRARALLVRGDSAIREVITELSRPLASNLPDRLYEVVEGIDEEFMVPVHLEISPDAEQASRRTRRAVAETIVKVTREALVNAAKHAGPCRASVTLDVSRSDRLRLRVADTGAGGDVSRRYGGSHGLTSLRRNVRRHGGSLQIRRGSSGGTTVTLSIPI